MGLAQEFEIVGAKSTTSRRPPGFTMRAASRTARAPSSMKCSTWWMMTTSKLSRGSARLKMIAPAGPSSGAVRALEIGAGDGQHVG